MVAFVARRYRLDPSEAEDLRSLVALKLYENDCHIVREFRQRSAFASYIRIVIQRIFLDDFIHQKGKWHPSAEATRHGPAAIALERLVYRDGLPLSAALAYAHSLHSEVSIAQLQDVFDHLPQRIKWVCVPVDETIVDSTPGIEQADLLTIRRERREMSELAAAAIRGYLKRLEERDRLMLQLQFESGMQITQIARALQVEHAILYRRRQKIFHELGTVLQNAGIGAREVADLVGHIDDTVDFGLKSGEFRPSTSDGGDSTGEVAPR